MEEQVQPFNPLATSPVPAPAPVPAAPPKSAKPPILIYILVAVVLILFGLIGLSIVKSRLTPAASTPIPTPVQALPMPAYQLSNIATQSAFLELASSVASLSTAISDSTILDQVLAPPALTLPLGF